MDLSKLPGVATGNAYVIQGLALPWVNIPGTKGYLNATSFYGYEPRRVPFIELAETFTTFWDSPKYNFNLYLNKFHSLGSSIEM